MSLGKLFEKVDLWLMDLCGRMTKWELIVQRKPDKRIKNGEDDKGNVVSK